MDYQDFEIGDLIDRGTFSKIYKVTHKEKKNDLAVKVYNKNLLKAKKRYDFELNKYCDYLYVIKQEITFFDMVKKDNNYDKYIIKYEGYQSAPKKVYLFLEYSQKGQLMSFNNETNIYKFTDNSYEDKNFLKNCMKNMLESINYLHSLKIAHLDIKLENFLIFNYKGETRIKLIDFNSYKYFEKDKKLTNKYGTFLYTSPECNFDMEGGYCPVKADIWALGVCFYAMLKGCLPFIIEDEDLNFEFAYSVATKNQNTNFEGIEEPFKELVCNMLSKDPLERKGINDLLKFKLFNF